MNYETLFAIVNGLALTGWVLLLLFYKRPFVVRLISGIVVALLCLIYSVIIFRILEPGTLQKFSTLQGVMSLMSATPAALGGWVHYLALDLMTGIFIATNSIKHGVKFILLLPCLLAAFFFAPFGLLLYFVIRWYSTGHYFATEYD